MSIMTTEELANLYNQEDQPSEINEMKKQIMELKSEIAAHQKAGNKQEQVQYTTRPLKVSTHSNPNSVAGALVAVIREQGYAEMQAVGAGALNQAIKAIAIARGFVAPSGNDL